MALETAFRRFALLPHFTQTGNGEPKKAHWLGDRRQQPATPGQDQNQGGQQDRPQRRPDRRGYRDLASIPLGEVDEAYQQFKNQIVPSPAAAWIAKNYFCQLPLKTMSGNRPPTIFGRVKTCYPSDGYISNIEQMELYFPRRDAAPDVIHLSQYDLAPEKPTQSYCVGVKCYVSEEEMADFSQSENIFIEKGFAPLYQTGYLDLLDAKEQNQAALSWLHVVGSGWFASIPDSVQPEIREQLRNMVRWSKVIFNYHPRRYSLRYLTLNEELDFQYGFTEHYLVMPQDTAQVLKIMDEAFERIFMRE